MSTEPLSIELRWVVYLILGDQVVWNVTTLARSNSGGEIVEGADLNSYN